MTTDSLYIFDEFFTSGLEESISPFLKKSSRRWAKHLYLKSSLISASFLLCSFITSFFSPNLSHLFLLFVYFFSGTPALLNTIEDIKNLEINVDVLMTMASFLSFLIGSQMEGGLLLVLFAFSGAMEGGVSQKARGTLHHLHTLSPAIGTIIEKDGSLHQKSVKAISIGTHLLIKAGEVVPLDGVVIEGHSFVNLVHLTGESIPVAKKKGDAIQAGSRNLDGTLSIKVNKTSAESTLSRIIQLIHDAQAMKPRLQRFLDKFSKLYAMIIISFFALFAVVSPFILSISFFGDTGSIYRALTFLIAASPCALIIATPTAYWSAINSCARKGILLKGGITLDALAKCKTIAFDKTGTLTTGQLSCTKIECCSKGSRFSTDKALSIACSLERNVTHPIAKAICALSAAKHIRPAPITHFQSIPGFGLRGKVDGIEVKLGNEEFIKPPIFINKNKDMLTFLLIGDALFSFHFEDTMRTGIKTILHNLRKRHNLDLIMLTGDHENSASTVAQEADVNTVYANLRPEHKVETIAALSAHHPIAMVGDGINDAPALTRAHVGISMGKIGSATAVDASDIVLLHDDLSLIDYLYRKANQTVRIVRENLFFSLGVIALATTPALLGVIPIWLAVLLHEGGTVLVGLNSLRLLKG